jgi:hypothetical protein
MIGVEMIILWSLWFMMSYFCNVDQAALSPSLSSDKICIMGKWIDVSFVPNKVEKDADTWEQIVKLRHKIRQIAIEQVIKDIPSPNLAELELWCRGYLLQAGIFNEFSAKAAQAVELERKLILDVLGQVSPTLATTQTTVATTQFAQLRGMTYEQAVQSIKRRFPTRESMKYRLKELDKLPPIVALLGETGEWQLRLNKFVEQKYGSHVILVTDKEIRRTFSYLNSNIFSTKQNREALLMILKSGKAMDIFEKYILEEMQKKRLIVFNDPTLQKLIIKAQEERIKAMKFGKPDELF